MARKALPHRMCDQRVPLTELILKMPQAPGRAEWPASAFGYFAREQSASQSRDCAKSAMDGNVAQIKPLRSKPD